MEKRKTRENSGGQMFVAQSEASIIGVLDQIKCFFKISVDQKNGTLVGQVRQNGLGVCDVIENTNGLSEQGIGLVCLK